MHDWRTCVCLINLRGTQKDKYQDDNDNLIKIAVVTIIKKCVDVMCDAHHSQDQNSFGNINTKVFRRVKVFLSYSLLGFISILKINVLFTRNLTNVTLNFYLHHIFL